MRCEAHLNSVHDTVRVLCETVRTAKIIGKLLTINAGRGFSG